MSITFPSYDPDTKLFTFTVEGQAYDLFHGVHKTDINQEVSMLHSNNIVAKDLCIKIKLPEILDLSNVSSSTHALDSVEYLYRPTIQPMFRISPGTTFQSTSNFYIFFVYLHDSTLNKIMEKTTGFMLRVGPIADLSVLNLSDSDKFYIDGVIINDCGNIISRYADCIQTATTYIKDILKLYIEDVNQMEYLEYFKTMVEYYVIERINKLDYRDDVSKIIIGSNSVRLLDVISSLNGLLNSTDVISAQHIKKLNCYSMMLNMLKRKCEKIITRIEALRLYRAFNFILFKETHKIFNSKFHFSYLLHKFRICDCVKCNMSEQCKTDLLLRDILDKDIQSLLL